MKLLPGPETRAAVASHPFVLAGLAVVVLLGLTAGTLVVIDSIRDDTPSGQAVVVEPKTTATPGPISRTATAGGFSGTTNTTTAVRFAPGNNTSIFGTLRRGAVVQIDGRTTDTGWYRIVFPPDTESHGWVDAENIDVTGDPELLAIATAEPPIIVDLPTQPPVTITPIEETPLTTETPEGTPTPGGPPDLVVDNASVVDGKLVATIVNQGTGDFSGDLVVAVFNFDGTALVGGTTLAGFTLGPGLAIDVPTGYDVTVDQTVTIVVDPNGDVEETDNTNNRIVIAVAVGNETPESPLPFETPAEIVP
jgi:hypothetical protein